MTPSNVDYLILGLIFIAVTVGVYQLIRIRRKLGRILAVMEQVEGKANEARRIAKSAKAEAKIAETIAETQLRVRNEDWRQ